MPLFGAIINFKYSTYLVVFFSTYVQGRIKALRGPRPIPNSSGGYTRGWEKLAIFDGNRRLSLKRCEIGQVTIQNIFSLFS